VFLVKDLLAIIGWSAMVFGFSGYAVWMDWPDIVSLITAVLNLSIGTLIGVPFAVGWAWFLPKLLRDRDQ
jgi:hypothetical protein